MEEKENERKKDYMKLHERYTELLLSHRDLMERVKIMFGTDDGLTSNSSINLANLAGTLKSNLPKISPNEYAGNEHYPESLPPLTRPESLASSMPRQAWLETEMSYDDTTTIIEDVEELQRDKEKELRDRDHSLSGLSFLNNFFSYFIVGVLNA